MVEATYQAYPRHVGKQAALQAIRRALERLSANGHGPDWLLERVKAFAESPAGRAGPYTPHPATWFNRGSYDDDPAQWQVGVDHGGNGRAQAETPAENAKRLIAEADEYERKIAHLREAKR